jgi:phosphoribosyl 1,2-cyclic phosphate phosphodiesterase
VSAESSNNSALRLRILGTGTSIGVPVVGCDCAVCTSDDPHNNRTRTSAIFEQGDNRLLVDTSTDLRFQSLAQGVTRIDAVLLTHTHADHIMGLDDLRVFNFRQRASIPIHGDKSALGDVRTRFSYIFEQTQLGGGKPQIELVEVDGPFTAAGMNVTPIPLMHGELPVLGFRVGDIAYLTDLNAIPEESFALLTDLSAVVIDALRPKAHPTHFNLEQALAAIERIGAPRSYLTHLTHSFDHATLSANLPEGVFPAWDGLVIES